MDEKQREQLAQVRAEIDRIDVEIVRLIAQRGQQVARAGSLKSSTSDVPAPDRVEAVIRKVRELASTEGADPHLVDTVYRTMIEAFIQRELRQVQESSNQNDAR